MEPTIKSIRVGSRVLLGRYGVNNSTPEPIVWLKATPNCDFISQDVLDFICYDAKERNNQENRDCRNMGNPDYLLSNILSFMNTDQQEWYYPAHDADNAPMRQYDDVRDRRAEYVSQAGFLFNFEEYEVDSLTATSYDASGIQISSLVRLPSTANILGDGRFQLFHKKGVRPHPSSSLIVNKHGLEFTELETQYAPFWCIERGTDNYHISQIKCVDRSGYITHKYPADGCGFRPVCTMRPERRVEMIEDGVYKIMPYDVNPCEVCTNEEIMSFLGLV